MLLRSNSRDMLSIGMLAVILRTALHALRPP